jgi:hypothetical protein
VRPICWLVLPVGLLLADLGTAAAQGTPEQRQACTPDAIRLCSDFIPDVPKITKCMKAKYKELSEPCRLAMRHKHTVHRHYHRKKPTECLFPGACS